MKLMSRQNEGVLMVTQNNEERSLTLLGINAHLQELLGYDSALEQLPLLELLGHKTRKAVEEDVEFEHDAHDLLEVLSKHRQLRLKKQDGSEIVLDCQIMRAMARDRHHLFRIVLTSPDAAKDRKSITEALRHSFKGHEVLDAFTQLPDKTTMLQNVQLTESYLSGKDIDSCFVYVELQQNSLPIKQLNSDEAMKHIGHVVQRNLRADDVIGRMADNALGIILIDINKDTVHLALNRIKLMIDNDPLPLANGSRVKPVIRQSCVLLHDETPDNVLQICRRLLDEDQERDMVVFRGMHQELGMFSTPPTKAHG